MGLINDYSKRKKADIAMLYDFMLLLEKGAFYLAGERMKAPQFFNSMRGKSEVFNEGCRRMGEVLSNRSCKSGDEGWKAVWEKVLCGRVSDEKIKKMIVEMGGAFFEKMQLRWSSGLRNVLWTYINR